jgi:hypothetical protein
MFSDRVPFSIGCGSPEVRDNIIAAAHPDTRMLFTIYGEPDEARRQIEDLRERVR